MDTDQDVAELVTFTSKEAYVYAPLPAATSYGHRAELWNPDKWLQEVVIKVVTGGDLAWVRLLEKETGELFAECPLPHDGTPLTTAVEPVVDSSRYYVVKVVDRDSRKHAFIGIGFRDRMDSSDFSAALDDYRQYLRKKQEAEQMRQEFDSMAVAQQAGDADGSTAAGSAVDLSLKPGQTIKLNLSSSLKRTGSGRSTGITHQQHEQQSQQQQPLSKLQLPPPPGKATMSSGSFFKLQPPAAAAAVPTLFCPSRASAAAVAAVHRYIDESAAASKQTAVAESPGDAVPSSSSSSGSRSALVPAVSGSGAVGQPASSFGSQALHQELAAADNSTSSKALANVVPAAAVKASEDEWGDFVS